MIPHVLKLDYKLLPQLFVDNRDLEAALVGQEVAVISRLEKKQYTVHELLYTTVPVQNNVNWLLLFIA
jgi:hypothetical protein